jgi:spore maturation protein CgeB
MFYHSLVSDWNHGNAHFLRGIIADLLARGHDVRVYEPADGWSLHSLLAGYGGEPLRRFAEAFPGLRSNFYTLESIDLDQALNGADLVLVHEWNDHGLVKRIGRHRAAKGPYHLLFHDTHHRAVTDPAAMADYDLSAYDGVLAFGNVIRDLYLANGWTSRAWTWHEAADTRTFRPLMTEKRKGDVVWIGNWGDDERSDELYEFLIDPIKALGLKACVYGVRYPEHAREALAKAGIEYGGWLPNYEAPQVFARYRLTVHVPRRPYVQQLPGIPTIRPFEALACGIPLVCSPWDDAEHLFTPGEDYLVARDGVEMREHIQLLLNDSSRAARISAHGLRTVRERHTCAHRVNELLAICRGLREEEQERVVTA